MGRSSHPEIEDVQEPFCGSRKRDMVPLCDYDPLVAAEWFYEKNCGWGPDDFSHGSNVKAWWECQYCLRNYKATICNRVGNQSACPFCASKKVCSDNSLEVLFPEIAREWHPTLNKKLKVNSVMKYSVKRAWWLCSMCGHEWETAIADRTFLDAGCPACYRARVELKKTQHVKAPHRPMVLGKIDIRRDWYENPNNKYTTLVEKHPKIANQWHPTKNADWTADDFSEASGVKAWWLCKKGPDHEWQATINHRTASQRGCPFCTGQKVSKTSSLKYLYPQIAKQWHKTKNGKLKPENVTTGSDRKVWWQCIKFSDHEWQTGIGSRTRDKTGCPQCSGHKVSAQNCLQTEFPYIAAQLHPTKNSGLKGTDITARSSKKVWWLCKKGPDHEWEAPVCGRTTSSSGCPCCAGKKVSVTNSLATQFPTIAHEFHKTKNGKLTARDVTSKSDKEVWWQCSLDKSHVWLDKIYNRTALNRGCKLCRQAKAS
ncbi:hypothetical protein BH10CYA1_BH10CYA1_62810 [soil metagenome]